MESAGFQLVMEEGSHQQVRSCFWHFNAPFADLSDPTATTVSVMIDLGSNSVSQFDYNPSLGIDHPEQNKGGSCRQFHQCNKDSDCVAKLGWEYSCADVSRLLSHWLNLIKMPTKKPTNKLIKQVFQQFSLNFHQQAQQQKGVFIGVPEPFVKEILKAI